MERRSLARLVPRKRGESSHACDNVLCPLAERYTGPVIDRVDRFAFIMAAIKRILRACAPHFLVQLNDTRRKLAPVSNRAWWDACFSDKPLALDRSRFSILPAEFKRPLSFVVDIGANEGQWIDSLTKLVPVSGIWIFEPNPEAMKVCKRRLERLSGISYFDVAVGDVASQIELHVTASSDFSSVLQPRSEFLQSHYGANAADVVNTIKVKSCTLDSLVPESQWVDLLKIDVQGFERAVLAGARRVLSKTSTVLIEANLLSHYAGDDTLPALWNELAGCGFSFWNFSPPYLGKDGRALWADAVFVKSKAMGVASS